MSAFTRLPSGLLSRAGSGGRIAVALVSAAASRVAGAGADAELGRRLVAELDRMKGLGMKVGQILSTLDAGLPDATVQALARLQLGHQSMESGRIYEVVEAALGAPVGQLFGRFDAEPVASASIGQVHRAEWDGREVAVKVRYPDIEATLVGDLRHLGVVARLAGLATSVDGVAIIDELRSRLLEECDYRREAAWLAAVGPRLPVGVSVPALYPARCAVDVLTTGWVAGAPLTQQPDPVAARLLMATGWHTLFGSGFLHADPHPGNHLVGAGGVVLLDWGCVRRASVDEIEPVRRLFRSVLDGDRRVYAEAVSACGLVGDDRFSVEDAYAQHRWLLEPYLAPRYRFSPGWSERGRRFNGPTAPNQRYQAVPPMWIWLLRQIVGLHTVIGRLGLELPVQDDLRQALELPLRPLPDPCELG